MLIDTLLEGHVCVCDEVVAPDPLNICISQNSVKNITNVLFLRSCRVLMLVSMKIASAGFSTSTMSLTFLRDVSLRAGGIMRTKGEGEGEGEGDGENDGGGDGGDDGKNATAKLRAGLLFSRCV